jgi:hypothetical protein
MQLWISCRWEMWLGGLVVTLHIDRTPCFQVPLPFRVHRLAFGVWRLAFGVWRLAYSSSFSIWLAVRFDAIACPQRLEGSRFTPLQVLTERAEETNPELLDNAASRRLLGTSQRPEYHIRLDNTARSRTRTSTKPSVTS